MINRSLATALIDVCVFLGVSGDDIVDPDEAIRQLENIAACLKSLTIDEQDEFLAILSQLATVAPSSTDAQVRKEFLESLGENLGLTEPL
ncbi:hypothetical protein [Blastopirellula retiformator]|uniref:Tellurite resistance protein TerB n=1 Tax=Blastopirellula retiformator TaxID=2527970 RepID=A0A5C5V8A2_9BACT|nr:hypothetical protein [Blastopirellula retiformator]TWT34794.1 hypothetical protein Enr8_22080 [Blastopirellula retiformator]TWT34798.1 hypothetical protein Enr8_22120 [Blastopirellula retiformator]